MEFFSEHIRGMTHFALSLSIGSAMDRFRRSLVEVVKQRLVIQYGTCSLEATQYKEFVLELFCSAGSKVSLKRFLLQALPNGDWRNKDQIEVLIKAGISYNPEEVAKKVTAGLLLALCGKLFSTYPQHRWLGSDISVSEVGLLEAVHGLASATFEHMLRQLSGPRAQPERASGVESTAELHSLAGQEIAAPSLEEGRTEAVEGHGEQESLPGWQQSTID
eukprot:5587099-Amphidinium_carterae.1